MLFFSILLLAVSSQILGAKDEPGRKPNIIFILVDDLGYGDLGCFWQDQKTGTRKFDTPGLDKMASEGMRLTHHYVAAPVCVSSRGSFLQGRHQGHCDIRDNHFDMALPRNHTIASVMKQAGYHTVHIGKNGVAGGENKKKLQEGDSSYLPAHPLKRGFDRFFGYLFHIDGQQHYPQNGTTERGAHIYDGYRQINDAYVDIYTTDVWTAYAKKTIVEETARNPDRPFFIYLAYETPHFLMQVSPGAYPRGYGNSGGVQWTGSPSYCNTALNDADRIDSYVHPSVKVEWPEGEKKHVSMIRRIDNGVRDILQTLKDLNIDDNTLVVFTSDNGPHHEGNDPTFFQSYANMEGIKRDLWEAGIRVPTIAWWPKHIKAGSVNAFPSGTWDWLSTFVDLGGELRPAGVDGNSLVPSLIGKQTQRDKGYLYFEYYFNSPHPDWVVTPEYEDFPNHGGGSRKQMQALRMGKYMGVRYDIQTVEDDLKIYNVVNDPGQETDLAAEMPQLHREMKDRMLQVRMPSDFKVPKGDVRPYDDAKVAPAKIISVKKGVLAYAAFEGTWPWVPEFTDIMSSATATGEAAGPDLSVKTRPDNIGILFYGYINIPRDGVYSFYVKSDSGISVRLHDAHVIDDDFNHTGAEVRGHIRLQAGYHPIRIYYRHTVGASLLDLQYSGPGITRQSVGVSSFAVSAERPKEYRINANDKNTMIK